jgi:hypothetical protein
MLFPNFYVSSVQLALMEFFKRIRMSVSHSASRLQSPARIHLTFTTRSFPLICPALTATAVLRPRNPAVPSNTPQKTLSELFPAGRFQSAMRSSYPLALAVLCAGLACAAAAQQAPQQNTEKPSPDTYGEQPSAAPAPPAVPENYAPPQVSPVPLEWTPPALQALTAQAAVKTSFTLDRTLLQVAAGLMPDSEVDDRRVINKLDGVSVHFLRFGPGGIPDEDAVGAIRAGYHVRGWKHVVTSTDRGGPVRDQTTDVWVVLDGVNVRGAVVLAETPQSLTLITIAGNINPVDLLHLRGHFGIPRFSDGGLRNRRDW